ncbi:UNVERIFIED_CONTAM: hypothetical protein Slati_0479200 [Sesamum latifolium]|uniref:Uncharacterized protein n=1 Tax=Sesamum latifolium TaxID=2727402 RepID=A0AAW2Y0L9_9LAMI
MVKETSPTWSPSLLGLIVLDAAGPYQICERNLRRSCVAATRSPLGSMWRTFESGWGTSNP